MKYMKYGFYDLVTNPWFNIIIMIELAAIITIGNIVISVVNSRSVYYEPYADLMQHEGYVFTPRVTGKTDNMEILAEQYQSFQGDVSVTCSNELTLMSKSELLRDEFATEEIKYRNLHVIDDQIYSKFNIPLTTGRWGTSQRNSKGQIEAVVVLNRETWLKIGDVIPFQIPHYDSETKTLLSDVDMGELLIVGTIRHGGNYPSIRMEGTELGSNGRKNTRDVRNMYTAGSFGTEGAEFFISSAAAPQLIAADFTNPEIATTFITYETEPTDEIRKANSELLAGMKGTYITMSDFKSSSDSYLYEQYIRLMPILLGVFVIVLAELICSAALNTKKQLRNYGIYFLCGCRWMGCLKISAAYSAYIIAASSILSAAALLIFRTTPYANMFEQNYDINNICISLILVFAMLMISLIIPFFMVRRTSPVETIKEC